MLLKINTIIMFRGLIYIFLLLGIIQKTNAVTYFISTSGNDNDNGMTIHTSWRTTKNLKSTKLLPGDSILFHGGDVFYESLFIRESGSESLPIVISTYGDHARAKITGAVKISDFENTESQVYISNKKQKIKALFLNGVIQTNARYPDTGFFYTDQKSKYKGIVHDKSIDGHKDGFFTGSMLKIRPVNWSFETREVLFHEGDKIVYDTALLENIRHTYAAKKNMEFYFTGKKEFLDKPSEWLYSDGKVYFIPPVDTKLNHSTIEGVILNNGIIIEEGVKHVVVENLDICKFFSSGVVIGENASNIIIRNNRFFDIFEIGIKAKLRTTGCLIEKNEFRDIYGRGISAIEPERILIQYNNVKRIGLIEGYGFNGVNGATGILVNNIEDYHHGIGRENMILNNFVDSVGYNAIRLDGIRSLVKRNVVSNYMLVLNDGGGIYTFGGTFKTSFDNVFEENIIIQNAKGTSRGVRNGNLKKGIYLDAGAHNIRLLNNIIVNGYYGIHSNWCTHENIISGNVLFNVNRYPLSFNSNSGACDKKNHMMHELDGNIVVGRSPEMWFYREAKIIDTTAHIIRHSDNNTFINIVSDAFAAVQYFVPEKVDTFYKYSFDEWKNTYHRDNHSVYMGLGRDGLSQQGIKEFQDVFVMVNTSPEPLKVNLPVKCHNHKGIEMDDELELEPFKGTVFITRDKIDEKIINTLTTNDILIFHQ